MCPIPTFPSARRSNATTARSSPASSYGLTNCAERTAAFKAVSEGHRRFARIVIAGRSDDYCYPCGACRQVLYEFGPEMEVICLNKKGEEKRLSIRELLPCGFDRTWLSIDEK